MVSRIIKFILICSVVGVIFSSLANQQVFAVTGDDYFIYWRFDPPGIDDVVAVGGYVEYTGLPDVYGDERQYVYFLSGNIGYKVQVWVTDGDGNGTIDPRQHPDHYLPAYVGPIEPRHFEIVSSADLTGYTSGSNGTEEFYIDSSGVYLGAYPNGIHKWDHSWNYLGKVANPPPAPTESMAYNPADNVWYAGGRNRAIYELRDTNNDGSFLDETWSAIFTYPDYGGDHHDGMEYVAGYLWISDMTSDVIGKWEYDPVSDSWSEVERYTYTEPADLEGMGFGPNDHFWAGSGWGPNSYIYELGDQITQGYPVAEAGPDVPSYAPTIPITFDASGSHHTDPSKHIVLYEWDFEGDGTRDYTGTNPIVKHTYPAHYKADGSIDWDNTVKDYFATLRVTDDGDPALQDTDTCIVHITAPPWKPVSDPGGPYGGVTGVPIQLDGSKSYDPESKMVAPGHPWYETIAKYEWDLDYDGEFDDSTDVKPSWTWVTEGIYIIGLRVTDSQPSGPGGTVGPLDVDTKYGTVVITKQPPPTAKIETHVIDSANGTAKFTWTGSDDSTPTKDLLYRYRLVRPGPLYDEWSSWNKGTTKNYSGLAPGDYKFEVKAKDSDGAIQPDSATWEFTIGGGNLAPIARASDISGQPQTMYPDTSYTITAKYFDPDGRDNLKICYLQLKHPEKRLTMMWYQEDGHTSTYAGEEGANYLTNLKATATTITDTDGTEGYEIEWTFEIKNTWPEVENGIDFGVFASDDGDLESGWNYDDTNCSFSTEPALKCVVHLRPQGIEASIGVIGVSEVFDIYVGSSTGNIKQVRFSSDESPDGVATGEWTKWFNWDNNAAASPWDATVKTMAWSFATDGNKEICAEIRSGAHGVLDQGYAYMTVKASPVLLVHGFQKQPGYQPTEIWQYMAEVLSGRSISEKEDISAFPGHTFWRLQALDEDHVSVYISNYSVELSATWDNILFYAHQLQVELAKIRQEEGVEKVDIVAHSMGGLVARTYIENADFDPYLGTDGYPDLGTTYANDVRKLIMLGTPNHGAELANLASFFQIELGWITGNNIVSVGQMAVGSPFLDVLNHGCRKCSGADQLNPDVEYIVFAANRCNCPEFSFSLPSPGLSLMQATPAESLLACWNDCFSEGEDWTGFDGVVSMELAKLDNVELHACVSADHTALRTQQEICEAVRAKLLSQSVAPVILISDVIQVACPVHVTVTDQYGRILNDTGSDEIPGASMTRDEESDIITIYLNPNLVYDLYIEAYESGQFTLTEILQIQNDKFMINLFQDVPVTVGAKAKLTVIPGEIERMLEIDSDGDGTIDEEKQPIVIDEEEDVFPNGDSTVLVGPNPVTNTGTAFFYALPEGTSVAKLMIFNVVGQPIFETALDVTSSRFPSAGTWNPVDQNGVPLANGPYIYVLIADGKVIGRGKMVIQR